MNQFRINYIWMNLILSGSFLFGSTLFAEEAKIESLLSDKTIIVAKGDLSNIGWKEISQSALQILDYFSVQVPEWDPQFYAKEQNNKEWKKGIQEAKTQIGLSLTMAAGAVNHFQKTTGTDLFYYGLDMIPDKQNKNIFDFQNSSFFAFVAIPTEGKSQEELKTLRSAIKSFIESNAPICISFNRFGFFIIAIKMTPEDNISGIDENFINEYKKELREFIKKRFAKKSTLVVPGVDELVADNESVLSVLLTKAFYSENKIDFSQLEQKLNLAVSEKALPEDLIQSLKTNASNADLLEFSLLKLLLNETQKLTVKAQTKSEEDATTVYNERYHLAQQLSDYIEQKISETDPSIFKDIPEDIRLQFDDIYGNFLKKLLMKQNGDSLEFVIDKEFLQNNQSVLAVLILPAVQSAREAARRMQCTNNVKQIMLAFLNYHDTFKTFPAAGGPFKPEWKANHSWRVAILPYIEQAKLYDQIRQDEPWDSEWNSQFHNVDIPVYQCPSANLEPGMTTYSLVVGKETVFSDLTKKPSFAQITDGTSNTIAIVEQKTPVCWMDPQGDLTFEEAINNPINSDSERGLGSFHTKGLIVGMFDCSVRFISDSISLDVLKAMLTNQGGESSLY
ncbi:MAG: DUF1559 domain-containing protein [Planctomycetia bacterium]|nr:DUF1559 domain-containing protein [Planctomycetia bacterium]